MDELVKTSLQVLDFTVTIPTFNGAKRLPLVLDKLLKQTGLDNLNWEIIIIDNNSSDNTVDIVKDYQIKCKSNCSLRYVFEKQQGITFARMRAVSEARGEFLAFVDDDNLPEPDWILQSYLFGQEHPQAGAWSGQIHADFEVIPPANFNNILAFLAIREHGTKSYLFDAKNLRLPPGASLVVRKQAWCDSVPKQLAFSGRLANSMLAGDDTEALLYMYKAGWEIWYNPAMHTYHRIPHWRLEKDYLLSLARGCGLCIFQLRLINAKNWEKPIIFLKTILGNFRRLLSHFIKYRGQIKSDLVALFEVEFYRASMMSPFFSLNMGIKKIFGKNISI